MRSVLLIIDFVHQCHLANVVVQSTYILSVAQAHPTI